MAGVKRAGSRQIRVAIVDDHHLIREGVQRATDAAKEVQFVGEAGCLAEARVLLATTDIDVLLLDCRLPDGDGISLLKELADHPVRVVMLTCMNDEEWVRAAIDAGAAGFLTKQTVCGESLVEAIRNAHGDVRTVSPDALTALLGNRGKKRFPSGEPTIRERQVWKLLSQGKTNAEIALELFLSERTVKFHVGNILRKTGARTRAEATSMAYQSGLMEEAV